MTERYGDADDLHGDDLADNDVMDVQYPDWTCIFTATPVTAPADAASVSSLDRR